MDRPREILLGMGKVTGVILDEDYF